MSNKLPFQKLAFLLAVCAPALFLQGCGEKIDARQTETANGLLYKLHDSEPFTGTITNYPLNEFLNVGSCKVKYKKGLPDGAMTCETTDGEKLAEIEFKGGVKSGNEKRWDSKTGKLVLNMEWSSGRQNGSQEQYDPATGTKTAKINWANGQKAGEEQQWDATGKVLLVSLIWSQGNKSGFEKTNEYERNFKDGHNEGVARTYAVSQSTTKRYMNSESNYVNGKLEGKRTDWDEFGNVMFVQVYKDGIVQSQTKQRWVEGKIVATESSVNISEGGTDGSSDAIRKDGKEQVTNECRGGLCEIDIDWLKGKPVKGRYTERRGDKLLATYNGVPAQDGNGFVKDGIEKKWDANGNLILEVLWEKGVALNMTKRLDDGSLVKVEHPKSGENVDVEPGFPAYEFAHSYWW